MTHLDEAYNKWKRNKKVNPFTGRSIEVGGPTYQKLEKLFAEKGFSSRGKKKVSPQKKKSPKKVVAKKSPRKAPEKSPRKVAKKKRSPPKVRKSPPKQGESPDEQIVRAINENDLEAIKEITLRTFPVNRIIKEKGRTPLMLAAQNNNTGLVKFLLDNGANPNIKDTIHGNTPLHFAAFFQNREMIQLLLSFG